MKTSKIEVIANIKNCLYIYFIVFCFFDQILKLVPNLLKMINITSSGAYVVQQSADKGS